MSETFFYFVALLTSSFWLITVECAVILIVKSELMYFVDVAIYITATNANKREMSTKDCGKIYHLAAQLVPGSTTATVANGCYAGGL